LAGFLKLCIYDCKGEEIWTSKRKFSVWFHGWKETTWQIIPISGKMIFFAFCLTDWSSVKHFKYFFSEQKVWPICLKWKSTAKTHTLISIKKSRGINNYRNYTSLKHKILGKFIPLINPNENQIVNIMTNKMIFLKILPLKSFIFNISEQEVTLIWFSTHHFDWHTKISEKVLNIINTTFCIM